MRGCPVVVFIAPFKDIFLDAIRVWTPYVSYGGNGGCGEALHAVESSSFALWMCVVYMWLGRQCFHPTKQRPLQEAPSSIGYGQLWDSNLTMGYAVLTSTTEKVHS